MGVRDERERRRWRCIRRGGRTAACMVLVGTEAGVGTSGWARDTCVREEREKKEVVLHMRNEIL